jgi:hypothetical protein
MRRGKESYILAPGDTACKRAVRTKVWWYIAATCSPRTAAPPATSVAAPPEKYAFSNIRSCSPALCAAPRQIVVAPRRQRHCSPRQAAPPEQLLPRNKCSCSPGKIRLPQYKKLLPCVVCCSPADSGCSPPTTSLLPQTGCSPRTAAPPQQV